MENFSGQSIYYPGENQIFLFSFGGGGNVDGGLISVYVGAKSVWFPLLVYFTAVSFINTFLDGGLIILMLRRQLGHPSTNGWHFTGTRSFTGTCYSDIYRDFLQILSHLQVLSHFRLLSLLLQALYHFSFIFKRLPLTFYV